MNNTWICFQPFVLHGRRKSCQSTGVRVRYRTARWGILYILLLFSLVLHPFVCHVSRQESTLKYSATSRK